mgnify:CR=1 FL=1
MVEIQGKKITKSGNKLKGTEIIVVNIPEDEVLDLTPEDIPLDIIYEDSDIVVINKAPNLVVHPAHGNYSGYACKCSFIPYKRFIYNKWSDKTRNSS